MDASYHRHDISDKVWALLEPHLPGSVVNGVELHEIIGALSTLFLDTANRGSLA